MSEVTELPLILRPNGDLVGISSSSGMPIQAFNKELVSDMLERPELLLRLGGGIGDSLSPPSNDVFSKEFSDVIELFDPALRMRGGGVGASRPFISCKVP